MTAHRCAAAKPVQLVSRAQQHTNGIAAALQARLRHATETGRRHDLEVAAMMHLRDEQLAHEKATLSAHFMSQIAAVHQVERAAAQVRAGEERVMDTRVRQTYAGGI